MNIGTNIYTLRKEKKVTQAQLAEKLGVSEQSISKWENNQCAPDVSLFPVIADYFGISIDRIFGYHINSYVDEVKAIMKTADSCMDTYKEIEILEEGLKKYPSSPDLKIYLAFSLSMLNRISDDEGKRNEAVKKAIKLCEEVFDSCGDIKQVDKALHMLARIYNETENYSKAEECINKISAERYDTRITEMLNLLKAKNCFFEVERFAKDSLWKLYWTMNHVFEHLIRILTINEDYEKALAFFDAHEKLLGIFDRGCPDFNATYKIINCESKAETYMKIGDTENCLKMLRKFFDLAEQVKTVAVSTDFNIAVRNPTYFSKTSEEFVEEYITDVRPEKVFSKYDGFFGNNRAYQQFKNKVSS